MPKFPQKIYAIMNTQGSGEWWWHKPTGKEYQEYTLTLTMPPYRADLGAATNNPPPEARAAPAQAPAVTEGMPLAPKEWFMRRAAIEGDTDPTTGRLGEFGTPYAKLAEIAFKALPQWAQNRIRELEAALSRRDAVEGEISPYEWLAQEFDRLAILRKMWTAHEVAAMIRRHDIERASPSPDAGRAE